MIKSFRDKGLEDYFYDGSKKRIKPDHAKRLAYILDVLDAAVNISDIDFPGSNLHKLEPKKENRWAVKVSGNWRVTFVFEDQNVFEVNYLDYH